MTGLWVALGIVTVFSLAIYFISRSTAREVARGAEHAIELRKAGPRYSPLKGLRDPKEQRRDNILHVAGLTFAVIGIFIQWGASAGVRLWAGEAFIFVFVAIYLVRFGLQVRLIRATRQRDFARDRDKTTSES
jgi:hypothetical protein